MLRSMSPAVVGLISSSITQFAPSAVAISGSHSMKRYMSMQEIGGGGRSSVSGVIATVFGASGFAGRYVVNRLGKIGSQVLTVHRGDPLSIRHLKLMGDLGQIVPVEVNIRNIQSVEECIYRSNVVVNLHGRRWNTRNFNIDQSNHESARIIAQAAKNVGVEHFIHVSALGASESSNSEWARAKAKGEQAVREILPQATILRPGPLFGAEDRLLTNFAAIVRSWPAVPLPAKHSAFQPLCVHDLAAAVTACIENAAYTKGKVFELAGTQTYTYEQLISILQHVLNIEKPVVYVPEPIASLAGRIFEVARKPKWLIPDELAFARDSEGAIVKEKTGVFTIDDLDIKPMELEASALQFIRHFRKPMHINLIIE